MPTIDQIPHRIPDQVPPKISSATQAEEAPQSPSRPAAAAGTNAAAADDGTNALLKAGVGIVVISLLSLLLTETVFGGIGIYGARSNAGWLSLMFALMGVPFGLMLLVLGIAKWLRKRNLRRNAG